MSSPKLPPPLHFYFKNNTRKEISFQSKDTNYLDAVNPDHLRPERIRLALLGALR